MTDQHYSYQQDRMHHHDGLHSPYSPRHDQATSAFRPGQMHYNAHNLMLPSTTSSEPLLLQPRSHHGLDLTPHSAVSSFNLPAHCDASLMTPVSMTNSPALPTRAGHLISEDREIKLSPSATSPYHHMFTEEDDFGSKYHLPMKYKNPNSTLQIHTTDTGFPQSYVAPEPYYGGFGVSATSASRAMASPPITSYNSPSMNSAGGYSNDRYRSHEPTPPLSASSSNSYRSMDAPILIAPNPMTLRPATHQDKSQRRQKSINSDSSSSSTRSKKRKSSKDHSTSPAGGKKRKSEAVTLEDLKYPDDLKDEDQLLLELRKTSLSWKGVVNEFLVRRNETVTTACLQMRMKRLTERIINDPINSPTAWNNWTAATSLSPRTHEPHHLTRLPDPIPSLARNTTWHEIRSTTYPSHQNNGLLSFNSSSASDYNSPILSSSSAARTPTTASVWGSSSNLNSTTSTTTTTMEEVRAREGGEMRPWSVLSPILSQQQQEVKEEGGRQQQQRRPW